MRTVLIETSILELLEKQLKNFYQSHGVKLSSFVTQALEENHLRLKRTKIDWSQIVTSNVLNSEEMLQMLQMLYNIRNLRNIKNICNFIEYV